MGNIQKATLRCLLTSLLLLVSSSALQGQASSDESAGPGARRVTAVAGLGNDMGWFGVGAEFYFSEDRFSAFGGVGSTPGLDVRDPLALTFAAGVRAYTLGIIYRGFAEVSFSQVAISERPFSFERKRHYGPGIQVGFQSVRAGGATFMVSAGAGYALGEDEFDTFSRVQPLLNLVLGYTWRRPE